MRIDSRVIRAEPHPEIGALLQRDAATVVERWCRRALEEQPDAKRVHHSALRDHLPSFLQVVGRSLMQAGNSAPGQLGEAPSEHGAQRWDTGWSVTELVRDYQMLQLVVFEYLEESLNRPLRSRETMAVGVFIEDAIAASVASYVASRDEHVGRLDRERVAVLEEASRRKDEFIAMLAHELRNPLAPIVNSAKALQLLLVSADPDVLKPIEVIDRQGKHLARLVDDLLDLGRIVRGRLDLRKTRVNLSTVLDEAIQAADPLFRERDHQFSLKVPLEPLHLQVDPARLVQVVGNLLNNAAKYTPRGGHIALEIEHRDGEVTIHVRDDGSGIPPEMQPRVFDMFMQAEGTRRHPQSGLGIGLSLVHRLVQLHGGTVSCRSDGLGKGSEFIVRLPIRPEDCQERATAQPPEEHAFKPCRLLVIEDHADARDSMAKLLNLMGHHAEVAENGSRGIESALAVPPDVALVDIGLPDVDGFEVAKQLRAALGDRIFLIAMTGYGGLDDLHAAFEAGFDARLVKPVAIDELNSLLARAPRGPRSS